MWTVQTGNDFDKMKETIKYTCSCCGKEHEEWPALGYTSPTNYEVLSEEEKEIIAELSSDFCTIRRPDQIDNFIRVTLTFKVIDHCQDLEYGLWVSLSDKSFQDYKSKGLQRISSLQRNTQNMNKGCTNTALPSIQSTSTN